MNKLVLIVLVVIAVLGLALALRVLAEVLIFFVAMLIFGFIALLLRAVTARMMTGKWPHQDALSKSIYDGLP
jgi:hypothetical protein